MTNMSFPTVTFADWRALVERELAGRSFDKALVRKTDEGLAVQPLYAERPAGAQPGPEPRGRPFQICVRLPASAPPDSLAAELDGGADALWVDLDDRLGGALNEATRARTTFVFEAPDEAPEQLVARLEAWFGAAEAPAFALGLDPLAQRARFGTEPRPLPESLAALGHVARLLDRRFANATTATVSTLPYHEAGADGADEIALALSTGALYMGALLDAGLSPERAASRIALQTSVGRDTFLELCKLRALRVCWRKLVSAFGAAATSAPPLHAVCSSRTLSTRDPWVNMLRVSTQIFAAALAGADRITPAAFDEASGPPSALGRRVARNTGLVLREESALGRVHDPASGSYYLETLTDALARDAWRRFQELERAGGIASELASGRLAERLEARWSARLGRITRREVAIVGVSEFANLAEALPQPTSARADSPPGALLAHRDAEPFEALRARAEAMRSPPEALLITLGSYAESRPRAGFAANVFAAGGIRTRESADDEAAPIACLCGSDERYADEAAARARALKAAGCGRVLLAGRPGALEAPLREAGVDGFLFVGCDAVALLSDVLEGLS